MWERPERGARGPAPERSRGQITRAAVRLADAAGLASVSVRQVAKELGTGPASLYRYVAGRDDLVDLMVDAATGEIDLTVALTGEPVTDLVALATRTREVHLRHPWLLEVTPEAMRVGPRGLDYLEFALGALAPVRMTGPAKLEAVAVLNALVAMVSRATLQSVRSPTARQSAQAAYLATAAGKGAHPLLAQALTDSPEARPAAHPAADPAQDAQDLFERVVRRVLAGLLAPAPESPRSHRD
ncbi:TetR/AcrR family transcriptional regulator [Streptomyces angustmyceticus]|uniref:TetR/AcrR family transcriptional regulator n=1 Tax=Streptomyces angustmyceticus TaxID=285578 RepID=UPI001ABF947B|nr:TetR/AcrR family transcriptional regulator C-terminal domain-containing protein [Streptomyces angustmyceticus]UAL71839.1 TetR/AcrR family transcriptional regulator [Streptomyces angustmyceticus]